MRIYTEVIFNWDDKAGRLVETSSKSFDYEGELILAGKVWKERTWYDLAGNKWTYQVSEGHILGVPTNEAGEEQYLYNDTIWQPWHNITVGEQNEWSKSQDRAMGEIRATKNFVGDKDSTLYDTLGSSEQAFFDIYGFDPNNDPSLNRTFIETYAWDDPAHYDVEGNFSGALPDWAGAEQDDRIEPTLTEEEASSLKAAKDTLVKDLSRWEDILDPDEVDRWQVNIERESTDVGRIAEDLEKAYLDIFEEYTEATEDMDEDVDRLTGAEGTYTTGVEEAEDAYEKSIRDVGKAQEEGLEGTVETREGEITGVREAAAGAIREAEARRGAAGFAGVGAGQSARDILARQISRDVTGTEEEFVEAREKVRDIFNTAQTDAETLREKTLSTLETTRTNALTDYKKTRDEAVGAKEDIWEEKSREYEQALEDYRGTEGDPGGYLQTESELAITEGLQQIQADMERTISTQRAFSDKFADWDPFVTSDIAGSQVEALEGRALEFGWEGDIMAAGAPRAAFEGDLFGGKRYEEYVPTFTSGAPVEDFLYDPEFVPTMLAKEEEEEEEFEEYDWFGHGTFLHDIGISDRRAKKDIVRISKMRGGIPVYLFRYKWSDRLSIGAIAQDVEKVMPEAVITIDGVKAINYSMLKD